MDKRDELLKEFGSALKAIMEQLVAFEQAFATLSHSVGAVKVILAKQISPGDLPKGLVQIQSIESEIAKLDPKGKVLQEAADLIEAVKLMEQHGGVHES